MMTLLREWQVLEAILMPVLLAVRPAERIVAWNLGHLDDALAVTLAYLRHRPNAAADAVRMFHFGAPLIRQPVEWSRSDLRSLPETPWIEPSPVRPNRWTPRPEVLDAVTLGPPREPVDLLISPTMCHGGDGSPLENVRRGGHVFLVEPRAEGSPLPACLSPVGPSGRLFRKRTPARRRDLHEPEGLHDTEGEEGSETLARHHERALLVDSHTDLARSLARRFANRGERLDDLEQVALTALLGAADRYDPGRERPFGVYATTSIIGELKRHFRDRLWSVRVPRSVQETHLAIKAAREELEQKLGASPTISQLAQHTGISDEAILSAMEAVTNSSAKSLDVSPAESDAPGTEVAVTDDGFERALERRVLSESADLMSPTERLIVKRVFFEGLTQRQVAEELGVSQMQISRLTHKALGKIRGQFQVA